MTTLQALARATSALAIAAGALSASAQDMTGAGATFPAPIYASLVDAEEGYSLIWSRSRQAD